MYQEVSGGQSGATQYLVNGAKKGREYTREELDKRITLSGDIDMTESIIESMNFKENYLHITHSWKEDYVSQDDLQRCSDEFERFAKAAYRDDEINFYAESHLPKVKSFKAKNGELVIRKPHNHSLIVLQNLYTGKKIEPFGYIKDNIRYLDAFKELHNQEFGYESPKDNMSNQMNIESTIISRQKGDIFERNKSEKEEILNYVLENKISNYKEFRDYLESQGTVKVRNAKKENPYFNLKLEHHSQGMNLKEFCFSREFIEDYSYEDKIDFLQEKTEEKFIEKEEKYQSKQTAKYEQDLKDWFDYKAKEIKYINYDSKYYKEQYKRYSRDEKIFAINRLEKEFYKNYDLQKKINKEFEDYKFADGELKIKLSKNNNSVISQKLTNYKEENELKKIDFQQINLKKVYEILKSEKGVLDVKYKLDEKQKVVKAGSKELDTKEFLVEQMNLLADEIHLLSKSIQKIEEIDYNRNLSNMIEKGNSMAIQVNIKTNEKNKNQIDYMQVGTVDRIGRYTGFIYDQADNERKSSATLFVVNDKVVDYEEFKKLPSFKELDNKMNSLVNASKEEHYSKELKMNYIKEKLSLTQQGQSYANSKFNFNELRPIEAGISKFKDMKSLDKNIFIKAKEFVLENWYKGKDKIQFMLTSKKDLAASNILLAAELKEMKASLEHIKTYQQALEEKNTLLQQQTPKENNTSSQETESSKEDKKEYSFKEVYEKVKALDGKLDNAKDIKELSDNSQDFVEKRDTALELLNNIKENSSLINLDENQINSLTQKEAQTLNLMVDNKIPVNSKDSIGKVINMLKNVKSMSIEQGLDFEQLLAKTMDKLVEKHATKEQNKESEQER